MNSFRLLLAQAAVLLVSPLAAAGVETPAVDLGDLQKECFCVQPGAGLQPYSIGRLDSPKCRKVKYKPTGNSPLEELSPCKKPGPAAPVLPDRAKEPSPKPVLKKLWGAGSGGCGGPVYSERREASCGKTFRMRGFFEGKFPCGGWGLEGNEASLSLANPYSEGTLTPLGLWLGTKEPAGRKPAKYNFKWKDSHGEPGSQLLARQVQLAPDLTGLLAEETPAEVLIYPELKGTPYRIRGLTFYSNADIPCTVCTDAWWSVATNVIYWPTKETCSEWTAHWVPALPGPVEKYSKLLPLKNSPDNPPQAGEISREMFEMTYTGPVHRCGKEGYDIRQKVRVMCVQGKKGLYTYTFDATEGIFNSVLPILENSLKNFKLTEEQVLPAANHAPGAKGR